MTPHATPLPVAARLLLLSPDDNCLVDACDLAAGDEVVIDGATHTLPAAVRLGHKVARTHLEPGTKVLRYGALIGSATSPIERGEHVHTHNLASDYIPTYTLAAGQRFIDTPKASS